MKLVAMLFMLAVVETAAAAADLTGTWQLHLDPDFGGEDDTIVCTFTQDGGKLTIRCGGGLPLIGDVNRDKVRFEGKTGPQNEFTSVFTGVLDDQAKTMKGTWHLDMGREVRDGKFDARRQQ
jgi:hypothetical protein